MTSRILIFGGTTEGRELAEILSGFHISLTLSVATSYGREVLPELPGASVLTGRMTCGEMEEEMKSGYDWVVDATHPYATEASRNIRLACGGAGVPLLRLTRAASVPRGCLMAGNAEEAARMLSSMEGRILLTTGSKELSVFSGIPRERLFVRVLPSVDAIRACEEQGISHSHILALQGPFGQKMNEAMLEQYEISVLVTKDGGASGGFEEKRLAAEAAGAQLLVIGRPEEEKGWSMEEVVNIVRR